MKVLRKTTAFMLAAALTIVPFATLSNTTADTTSSVVVTDSGLTSSVESTVEPQEEPVAAVSTAGETSPETNLSLPEAAEGVGSSVSDIEASEVTAPDSTPDVPASTPEVPDSTSEAPDSTPVTPEPEPTQSAAPAADVQGGETAVYTDEILLAGTSFTVSSVTVVGTASGAFLNGISWTPTAEVNQMQRLVDGLYTITFKGCQGGTDVWFKFALNKSWEDSFGAAGDKPLIADTPTTAEYNGGNFKLPEFEGTADVTIILNLQSYDHETTTGGLCTVTIAITGAAAPAATATPTVEASTVSSVEETPTEAPTEAPTAVPTEATAPTSAAEPTAAAAPTGTTAPTPSVELTTTPTPTPETEVTSVTLNRTTLKMPKGRSFRLKATVSPTDAGSKKITWTSSNTKVAKVSSNGYVTAIKNGTSLITATAPSGVRATCKITVYTRKVYQFTKSGLYRYTWCAGTKARLLNKGYTRSYGFSMPGFSHTKVYWITPPGTGHHHLTTDYYEAYAARMRGYKAGFAFFACDTPTSKPVYELMQMTKVRNYRYTTDVKVRDYLRSIGWVSNGIAFYSDEM